MKDYRTACELGYSLACENYRSVTGYYLVEIPKIVNQLVDESSQSFQKAEWRAVIDKTTQALELGGPNAIAYSNRAGAYANLAMLKEASDDCDKAIKIDPDYALAYNNRGYVQERLGQRAKAQLDYEIACNLGLDLACNNFKRLSAGK